MADIEHVENLIKIYTKHLRELEEQAALQGLLVDSQTSIAIEQIKEKIEELHKKRDALKNQAAQETPSSLKSGGNHPPAPASHMGRERAPTIAAQKRRSFYNRKEEINFFRKILRRETSYRGLIIHSRNQGGVGKSTLLRNFEKECGNHNLPVPTTVLFFDAKDLVSWERIMDKTISELGEEKFPTYTTLQAVYRAGKQKKTGIAPAETTVTAAQTAGQKSAQAGSGETEIDSGEPAAGGLQKTSEPAPGDASLDPQQIRDHLTHQFLEELERLSENHQLVWLVDTAEKLDDTTKAWLVHIFKQIKAEQTRSLVLVVAGKEMLPYDPVWLNKIEEKKLTNFDEDTILQEIVLEMWPDEYPERSQLLAQLLFKISQGKPADISAAIQSVMSR